MATSTLKVLVTGASGQLGRCLQEEGLFFKEMNIVFLTKEQLDITSKQRIVDALTLYAPDIIINTAAYTAVDAAEADEMTALKLNVQAVKNLVQEAERRNIALVHISTDYVFDGKQEHPYTTDNFPNPQTVYGKTKLAGEEAILNSSLERYAIIRTSWLYSRYGTNFVKTMLKLARERSKISVVDDQIGSPTWALDLARAILTILPILTVENKGVYQYVNEGAVSWFAFAKAIFHHQEIAIEVDPIASEKYPTAAERPKNSVLDSSKIKTIFGVENHPWEQSLQRMLNRLKNP